MKAGAYHILRVSMAITFLWIAILIFQDPVGWGGFLQPWAQNFLFLPIEQAMLATAVLDVVIGVLLLLDVVTWLAAIVGGVHLLVVLATTGIDGVTVRDIGLLGAAIALAVAAWPKRLKIKKEPVVELLQ
jgi:uncharacterized membrane protein YphA (DoxX/SURF4 family)